MQQATIEIGYAERLGTLLPQYRAEVNRLLASGQGVPELASRGQSGGAGSENPEVRVFVGGDLQQAARVVETVHLVEHQHRSRLPTAEEQFRIFQRPHHRGQVAVHVHGIRDHAGKRRLSDPTHAGEPYKGSAEVGRLETIQPDIAL